MKKLNIILKIILSLILLMPIIGTLGIFPAPTADMYNNPQAFEFIQILMETKYINAMMAVVFAISFVLIWTKRMALAALLMLPVTLNIVAFHMILDGGLFTAGAMMGNVFFILNIYFLFQNKEKYAFLLNKEN